MKNTPTLPEQGSAKTCAPKTIQHERQRTLYDYFLLDIFHNLPLAPGTWMPELAPFHSELPDRMVSFSEALSKQDTNCIVHFYEDDRRFLRLFRHPERHIDFLRRCKAVIEPDLSQYVNMALPIRQAHAYLNRAMAAYLQREGVDIIPNITWSRADSYTLSMAGVPRGAVIAVNCTGIIGHDVSLCRWREGYKNVVLSLTPTTIIRYGDKIDGERTDISIYSNNERLTRLRNGSKRK